MLSIKPAFQSTKPDDPEALADGQITPSRWNADLATLMATARILGRTTAGNGPIEELDAATVRTLLGIILGAGAGNVPVLDGSGKLATSTLPALALTEPYVVSSQAAMLALSAQQGDIAIRTDLNRTFILATNSPSALSDWKELLTPTDVVQSVAGLTGAISAAALRTALNLVVGTDVQAYSAKLADISGLTLAGNATKALVVNAAGTGFELVAAGGGSVIKSIQTGYVSSSSLSTGTGEDLRYLDVTISAVTTAKSFVMFVGGAAASIAYAVKEYGDGIKIAKVTLRLTSSTNLRISIPSHDGESLVAGRWTVVEYN